MGLESRGLWQEPAYERQTEHGDISAVAEPKYFHKLENGTDEIAVTPFLRVDSNDDERSHFDVRELYWQRATTDYEVLLGVNRVFWGVAEGRHLVNIINQIDAVEDVDEEDYLGQPMVTGAWFSDYGTLRGYVLPGFRERTFPGEDGRLRGPFVVDTDNPLFESGAEEKHIDLAFRYTKVIEDYDIGLSHFWGTAREPRLLASPFGATFRLQPYYEIIHQTGLDLQATKGSWLWKYEGIFRQEQGRSFYAQVAGLEYTFYGIAGTDYDLGLLAEHLFDDRDASAPATVLDQDVLVGGRLTLNDIEDTELLGGGIIDLNDGALGLQLESSRRLNDHWTVELDSRFYVKSEPDNLAYGFRKDDHVVLRLLRYF